MCNCVCCAFCCISIKVKINISADFAAESELDGAQAVKRAAAFLKSRGYKNIKDSYFSTADGICTVNFAYYEDVLLCR